MIRRYRGLLCFFSAMALVLWMSPAFAGLRVTTEIVVVQPTATTNGSLSGNFGSARNSVDADQFLVVIDQGASALLAARDAAGAVVSCSTNDPNQLEQLRNLTDHSFIAASFPQAGACATLTVNNSSVYEQPQ